jgi:hypothetical protein
MGQVVVIGDVGGHPRELAAALANLGASDGVLPPDTTVIQVGDLVDRGPDSNGVLGLVQGYLERSPERWVQLVGNHESQYLPGGRRFWPEPLADWDADRLQAWWSAGAMNVAAAVRTADGDDLLVTHAGLTQSAWTSLGEPMTAAAAARLLNDRPPLVFHGALAVVARTAGPLWAEAGWELYAPWFEFHAAGGFVPFGQVHGHSSIVRYADQTWRCPGRVRQRATVDWSARHTRVRIGGRQFIGVDPKLGRYGGPAWAPLMLPDAAVLSPVPA